MVVHSAKSTAQYKNVLDTLERRYDGKVDFKNTDKVMSILGTKDNGVAVADNTLKSRLVAVMNHLKAEGIDIPFYYSEFKKVAEKLNTKSHDAETYIAKDTDFSWDDMKEAYSKATGFDKMVLGLYYLTPPRRLEYIDMLVVDSEPDNKTSNYLVIKPRSMQFVFNTYKTASSFGKQVLTVPKELRSLLKESKIGEHLLLKPKTGEPFTDAQFSDYLARLTTKLVGKKASASAFRHAFISHFLSSNPTTDSRIKMSKQMAHDVGTQLKYDRR